MPGLDLSTVSSNWKKLQSQLQSEKKPDSPSNGVKRKRPEARPASAFKRAKFSDANGTKVVNRRKMGYSTSKPVAADPSSTMSSLTRDHDIPPSDLSAAYNNPLTTTITSASRPTDTLNTGLHSAHKAGKYLALDCEMVGTGPPPHTDHLLARVSLVNYHGDQLYDSYVLPPPGTKIHDYRTHVSGIKPAHLHPSVARPYTQVRSDVVELLRGRILVGHALKNDLQVLDMVSSHPKRDLRDTSRYPPFRAMSGGRPPALRKLAERVLGLRIQEGEHSSVEDARASMLLFRREKEGFEGEVRRRFGSVGTAGRGGRREREVVGGKEKGVGGSDEEDDGVDDDDEDGFGSEEDEEEVGDGSKGNVTATKKKRKKKKRTKRK